MSEEMNLYKRCKNIFKFHGVDMGGGGGESAPEVENAIETHGLGWTETEEKAGFDIQWDGNTEGLETIPDSGGMGLYKVSDVLDIMNPIDNLIGTNIIVSTGSSIPVIEEDMLIYEDDKVFGLGDGAFVIIALEDGHIGDCDISKGVWFINAPDYFYVTRFYKESTTEEVVHQIDQKYIPSGSGGGNFIVNVTVEESAGTIVATADKDLFDIETAVHAGSTVTAIVSMGDMGSIYLGMSMYEEVPQGSGTIPYEAAFGPYVPFEGKFAPMLEAKMSMDGDTTWTLSGEW